MALTLTSGIAADADEFVVTGAVPANVGPDFRFRIDDELLRLQGFGAHTEIVGAYARQWAGKDPQRWLVERGVEHSTPASHAQGADVLAANDVFASSDDLTPPSPWTSGGGGSGIPQGGPLTEPLDVSDQALVSTDGIYLIADEAVISLLRRDAGAVVRSELLMASSEGRTDIYARDSAGTTTATWEVGEDGFSASVFDELGAVRATVTGTASASDETDAVWEWSVKNAAGTDKAKLTLNETGFHLEAVNVVEVPASPTEQDIVDALLALGLVTQAAP